MQLEGKKINFLGDSITQGSCLANPENVYHRVLMREEKLAAARDYGISGTRIAQQITDNTYDGPFATRYRMMDDDADIVVVFGGTNDFGHGDAPIGTFADRTTCTFYGALHVLMLGLLEKYPQATIVFMTPLHRITEDTKNTGTGLPLSAYVAIIREVAAYYALPVLDLFACSGIQPCVPVIRERYCPDGLHPNDAGHKRIAARLAGFLKTL